MNAHPWYRLHWVTYLSLLVTGGAVVYLQFHPYGWQYGWPFVYIDRNWPVRSLANATWYPTRALGGMTICFAILGSTAYCSEHLTRNRFRMNLRSALMFMMAVAVAFSWAGWEYDITSQGHFGGFPVSPFLPNIVSTTWAPLPIRIVIWFAIACTFNIIGWLVLRGSAKCGRLVSRMLTTA